MISKWCTLVVGFLLFAGFSSAQVNNAQIPQSPKAGGNTKLYDFSFVSTDVAAVLQALAVTAGVDIVPSPEVRGTKIDIKITRKSWQEALDILCNTYDLTWIIEDKYISVLRTATYQARLTKEAEKKEQSEKVAPLIRKNFKVRHAKASDLVAVIQNMTSPRGRITVVDRNNAIIVYDSESRISQMEKALVELDVETQQIMITGKLVVVDSKVAREFGVDWSAKAGTGSLVAGGTNPAVGQIYDSPGQLATKSMTGIPANPLTGQIITMSLMDNNLGVNIYNLIGEGHGEILASPQISTLDHTEAKIFMGDKISIRVIDEKGISATQLVESGIKLTVTPHVTGDNRILLDLKPENNSWGYDDRGLPVISTQDAQTKVVVADGETVVIGGLTKNEETESETGIPFLKDIPLLGNLFKYYKKEVKKKDLIIFVTPRIQRSTSQEMRDLQIISDAEADSYLSESQMPVEIQTQAQEKPLVERVGPAPQIVAPKASTEPAPAPSTAPQTPTAPPPPPPASTAPTSEEWN